MPFDGSVGGAGREWRWRPIGCGQTRVGVVVQQIHCEIKFVAFFRQGRYFQTILSMIQPQNVRNVMINVFNCTVLLIVCNKLRNQCPYVIDKMAYLLKHYASLILFGKLLQQIKQMFVQIGGFLLLLFFDLLFAGDHAVSLRVVTGIFLQMPLHAFSQIDLVARGATILQRDLHFPFRFLFGLRSDGCNGGGSEGCREVGKLFDGLGIGGGEIYPRDHRRGRGWWRWQDWSLLCFLLNILEKVVRIAGRFREPSGSSDHDGSIGIESAQVGRSGS